MYAAPASYRDGSTLLIVPSGGRLGMFLVTFVHVLPPSRVRWSRPSLVPAQRKPASFGDSAIAKTTLPYSTPMLSGVRPPELCWWLLSFVERSGLISCQLWPPSVDWCTCWLPMYSLLRSCGEIANGAVHTKRYFRSAGGPFDCSGHTSTSRICRRLSS